MLRFTKKPDVLLSTLIKDVLEDAIEKMDEDLDFNQGGWAEHLFEEEIIKAFGGGDPAIRLLKRELEKLLKAHESEKVYMPTDWHFKLLDRLLHIHIDCYNDMSMLCDNQKEYEEGLYKDKDSKLIYHIDFGGILDFFFWDTDYDFPTETAVALKGEGGKKIRTQGGITDVAVSASLNEPIDGKDILIKEMDPPAYWKDGDEYDWNDNGITYVVKKKKRSSTR